MSAQTVACRWVRDWTPTVDCGSTPDDVAHVAAIDVRFQIPLAADYTSIGAPGRIRACDLPISLTSRVCARFCESLLVEIL